MDGEERSDRRVQLGVVGVDSGTLIVVDPSYIESEWESADGEGKTNEAIDVALSGFGGQLNYRVGHPGLAVAFPSGFGDGMYEVWATIRDCGEWGDRVAKVEIILVDEDHKGDDVR
jgi:hypothetical protein